MVKEPKKEATVVAEPVPNESGNPDPHAPLFLDARSYDVMALRDGLKAKTADREAVVQEALADDRIKVAGTFVAELPKGHEPEPEESRKAAAAAAQGKSVDEAEYVERADGGGEDLKVSATGDGQ